MLEWRRKGLWGKEKEEDEIERNGVIFPPGQDGPVAPILTQANYHPGCPSDPRGPHISGSQTRELESDTVFIEALIFFKEALAVRLSGFSETHITSFIGRGCHVIPPVIRRNEI
ncbi:hypothetical protein Btru_058759 [Bulinus truncatus]|nr:hypothetical protein Btru_058759 [Bulinus truncatus]